MVLYALVLASFIFNHKVSDSSYCSQTIFPCKHPKKDFPKILSINFDSSSCRWIASYSQPEQQFYHFYQTITHPRNSLTQVQSNSPRNDLEWIPLQQRVVTYSKDLSISTGQSSCNSPLSVRWLTDARSLRPPFTGAYCTRTCLKPAVGLFRECIQFRGNWIHNSGHYECRERITAAAERPAFVPHLHPCGEVPDICINACTLHV